MTTRTATLILLFMLSLPVWSQRQLAGKVLDADTGEPLPYAQVYTSDGKGCLTNDDGDFSIADTEADSLRVSFVGYATRWLSVHSPLREIRMQPCSRQLREVTVKPLDVKGLLTKLSRRLEGEYKKNKGRQGYYFCRVLEQSDKINDLMDAILVARSAVNLRRAEVLTGRHSNMNMQGGKPNLAYMNLHRILEVGPAIHDADFWADIIAPLNRVLFPNLLRYYDCDYDILSQPGGDAMYRITMTRSALAKSKGLSIIEGTLYVEVSTSRLLRFEARLPNMQMTTIGNQGTFRVEDVDSRINIDYRHTAGTTEVDHADVRIDGPKFHGQAFLFSLTGAEVDGRAKGVAVKGNMLNAMDEAGYDSLLWASAEVVKLTERERQVRQLAQVGRKPQDGQWNPAQQKADISLSAFSPQYKLAERLAAFGRKIPQEKVYIHMDNTCYQLGDTVWFSAYTRRTDTDRPSDVSGVLYVELYSQEGCMLERKLIEMRQGQGHGFFALDKPTQYAGFYELRAYTRWQLNWGRCERPHSKTFGRSFDSEQQEHEYFRDYEKLYSRVFPVYDRPAAPGDFTRDMTLRAMRRIYKASGEHKLQVSLYPEGGNLVSGLSCRMAFEAAWNDGEWADGFLVYGSDTARVQHRGRGLLTLTPAEGMEREARFVTSDGKSVSVRLPQVERTGVSLRLARDGKGFVAQMAHSGDLSADSLAVSLMHEGRLLAACGLEGLEDEDGQCLYCIGDSLLQAAGVYQLTVFDTQGRVFADRLFFSRGRQTLSPTLTITGLKSDYNPYEPVSLTLRSVAGRGSISLAVRDGERCDWLYDNGNILTEMLLASEIRGFVPQPGWYFEQDDERHRAALDLLMMTQGWRRFDWRCMAVRGAWELTQPAERSPILVCGTYNNDHWHASATSVPDINIGKDASDIGADAPTPITSPLQLPMSDVSQSAHRPENTTYEEVGLKRALDKKEAASADRRELKVHAELMLHGDGEGATYECVSRQGTFRLQLPPFYGQAELFLSVADTTRWKRGKPYRWIQQQAPGEEFWDMSLAERVRMGKKGLTDEATYMARICWPYPLHVSPYTYYQNHLPPQPDQANAGAVPADGTLMREVVVKSRRAMLRKFDDTWPVLMVDADVAQNMEADLGQDFMPIIVGNYGLDDLRSSQPKTQDTDAEPDFDIRYGYGKTRRSLFAAEIPEDSIYARKYLKSGSFSLTRHTGSMGIGGFGSDAGMRLSPGESREYMGNGVWDRYVLYSDYSPRMEGSPLYYGANSPKTVLVKYPFPDGSRRVTYRDRRYVIDGFAVPAESYSPDYSKRALAEGQADYRRTLYWNPDVRVDGKGEARILFYNNSRTTRMRVDAQGQAQDGTLLWTAP